MVVSVLTVILILGVSFVFSMNLETQVSRHFSATARARYVAEAGISHARALLDEDRLGSRVDDLTEDWSEALTGSEVDVDGDGTSDAKWWQLEAPASAPGEASDHRVGRYGVLINDEAGKINLNTGMADPDAEHVDAPNLTTLLTKAGVSQAAELARAIETYRYGEDGKPGVAGVDDDGNGAVDDPNEYQSLELRGDDQRFESLEEIQSLGHIDKAAFRQLAKLATVYSWDDNVSVTGAPRVNINTVTADELLSALLQTGVENPWQMAVNLADYADPDEGISRVSKVSKRLRPSNQGPKGEWTWKEDESGGHYETEEPGGAPLEWSASAPAGSAHVIVHGVPGMPIGDVTIAGETKPSMDPGELFGVIDIGGALSVSVTCRGTDGCAFSGIELVSTEARDGFDTVLVRGIEAVRINEIMVAPSVQLLASAASFSVQLSGWSCGSGSCSNSGTGSARWTWTNPSIRPGTYYVRVYADSAGQTVGEVRVNGDTTTLTHGQRHPQTVTVSDNHELSVTIGKTPNDGTYYFHHLVLSLAPDAEYIELINLSDAQMDVGGWTLNGDAVQGLQARIPFGTVIKPHGLLVAAVDAEDIQTGLAGNNISLRKAWKPDTSASVVQLEFPSGPPNPDGGWLTTAVPAGKSAELTLRNGEDLVDDVEYLLPLAVAAFQSLEKGDPTVIVDADGDGIDDGWYPSLQLFTPGMPNDNNGLRELKGQELVVHDPSKEITIVNHALHSVGELAGLPSGVAWKAVASQDLAKIADRLTVTGIRLEASGHLTEGEGAWRERVDGYETSQEGGQGTWRWTGIPDGQYRLGLYGWSGEQLTVRWQEAAGQYSEWIPVRRSDAQGRIVVGQISVGMAGAAANTLTLQVKCQSTGGVCHVNHVSLDPQLMVEGLVNVNTAPLEVLLCLPGMTDAIAQRIIQNRPYGDRDHKARGIGDLLSGSVLGEAEEDKLKHFKQLAHLLTVRSHVFRVTSIGESLEREHPIASQRIQAVVQR